MSHSFFVNPQNKPAIISLYPPTAFNIILESSSHNVNSQSNYIVSVDKLIQQNCLQIRLCETNDQTKMLLSTVDNIKFETIKLEQSLLVSYEGFVDHLKKILDSCKRNELFIAIQMNSSSNSNASSPFIIQFYEKRSFRNLVHLYLPIEEAPTSIVLSHINLSLINVQQQSQLYTTHNQKLQKEIQHRDEQINSLKSELKHLVNRLGEQENAVFLKTNEHITQLQTQLQQLADAKDLEIKKVNTINKSLQDRQDQLTKEIYVTNEKCFHEKQKADALRDEVNQLKLNGQNIKEQKEKLQNDLTTQRNHERKLDHLLSEARKQINELQDKYNSADKRINELCAALEAEKNICQTKRNALQIATDEISKANTIISKQNREIIQLKEKNNWRADIVVKQEHAIQKIEKEKNALLAELSKIGNESKETKDQRKDFDDQLIQIKKANEENENKYKKKIKELTDRLQQATAEKQFNKNTYRYLQFSNNRTDV